MTPPCGGAVSGAESKTPAVGDGGATYDIAFAGAGLSALSLAVRLAELPNPPRMLLIDPRTEFRHDRTWCYWKLHESSIAIFWGCYFYRAWRRCFNAKSL